MPPAPYRPDPRKCCLSVSLCSDWWLAWAPLSPLRYFGYFPPGVLPILKGNLYDPFFLLSFYALLLLLLSLTFLLPNTSFFSLALLSFGVINSEPSNFVRYLVNIFIFKFWPFFGFGKLSYFFFY